jgi:hypothetical protein
MKRFPWTPRLRGLLPKLAACIAVTSRGCGAVATLCLIAALATCAGPRARTPKSSLAGDGRAARQLAPVTAPCVQAEAMQADANTDALGHARRVFARMADAGSRAVESSVRAFSSTAEAVLQAATS